MTKGRRSWATAKSDGVMGFLGERVCASYKSQRQEMDKTGPNGVIRT